MPELQAPRLFGREAEEALAYEALTGQQRYVELRGGPGEGKTSLACLLAKRLCAQWEQQPKPEGGSDTAHAHRIELRGECQCRNMGSCCHLRPVCDFHWSFASVAHMRECMMHGSCKGGFS
jgi:hypothetical protein